MATDPSHVYERVVIPDPRVGEGYLDTVLRCEVYQRPGQPDIHVFSEAAENRSLRWGPGQRGLREELVDTLATYEMAPEGFRYMEYHEPPPGTNMKPYEEYTFAKDPGGGLHQTQSSIGHSQEELDRLVGGPGHGPNPW